MTPPARSTPEPFTRPIRAALIVYTITLAIATHWPRLRIEGPVPRTDIWIHVAAFALLTTLLALSALLAPRWSARNVTLSVVVALAYAAIDELTQAIPILGRTAALDDYLADAAGILLAGAALAVLGARMRSPTQAPADTPPQT